MQQFHHTDLSADIISCSQETTHHLVNVLRVKLGDHFLFTNGKGVVVQASVIELGKKLCNLQVVSRDFVEPRPLPSIAIAFTKNVARIEWFLEKATEIGVSEIFPLITKRSERTHFKLERWQNILSSAMCQSKQAYLPTLHEPIELSKLIQQNNRTLLIAHCMEGEKHNIISSTQAQKSSLILIGPEGDFNEDELSLCLQAKALAVSLGDSRLRTETAGIVALTLLNQK